MFFGDNKDWVLTLGIKPMILFGYRCYDGDPEVTYYSFYFAFIDICLAVYEEE